MTKDLHKWILTTATSTRYTLAFMLFLATFLVYAERVNLNVALVAMTSQNRFQNLSGTNEQCPSPRNAVNNHKTKGESV